MTTIGVWRARMIHREQQYDSHDDSIFRYSARAAGSVVHGCGKRHDLMPRRLLVCFVATKRFCLQTPPYLPCTRSNLSINLLYSVYSFCVCTYVRSRSADDRTTSNYCGMSHAMYTADASGQRRRRRGLGLFAASRFFFLFRRFFVSFFPCCTKPHLSKLPIKIHKT